MLRILLTASCVAALSTGALAADLYGTPGSYKDGPAYEPVTSWTGFYVGVNGGYGFGGNSFETDPAFGLGSLKAEGGFGGGQIGVNFQRGNFVYGVEADFQGGDISDSQSHTIGNEAASLNETAKTTLDWFGTVRGRLGYAFGNTLVYGTGGFAYGQIKDEASETLNAPVINFAGTQKATFDKTSTGYVVGAGVEHKFSPAWSVKAEYQYINLGQDSEFAKLDSKDFDIHTVRVGLNYHLGGGYEALK